MGNVVGQDKIRDKNTYDVLTGKLQFYADQLGGKRFFAAIKAADRPRGQIEALPSKGCISNITVSQGGQGYTSIPTVTITGGNGSGATARASIFNGAVTYITLIHRGSGYTDPVVTLSGGGGSGTVISCSISPSEPDIDISDALDVPGVRAILNCNDARGNITNNNCLTDRWGFFGAPVAAVVADDWHTAMYACGLIKVNCGEQVPWVSDPYEAQLDTAPIVTPGTLTNVTIPANWAINRNGNANNLTGPQFEAALTDCDEWVPLDIDITTHYAHNMLEPHGQTAWWVGDHCYIWTGSQNIHSCHGTFVSSLGRNASASGLTSTVHTFSRGTGGGHGDKNAAPTGGLCARLSLFVDGAPVTLINSRNSNFYVANRQSGQNHKMRIGGNRGGKIMAFEDELMCFNGQTHSATAVSASAGTISFTGVLQSFTIPVYRTKSCTCVTNTGIRGPWRCVGDPPNHMGCDAAIDLLASKLGMSPYLLRLNSLRERTTPALSGQSYYAMELPLLIKTVHDASGYSTKWHAPDTGNTRSDGRKHGIGIACHQDGHGSVPNNPTDRMVSIAVHNVNSVPHAFLLGGFGRGPSGAPSAMAAIAAERMGLGYDNVFVEWGQTDKTWPTGNQAGSQFTSGTGGAVYNAANKARTEILTAALGATVFNATNCPVPAGRSIAKATAKVTDDRITSFTIDEVIEEGGNRVTGGSGYTGAPRVSISGGGGSGATAVAYVAGGKVVSIGVINPGSGYTNPSGISVTIGWLSIEDFDPRDNNVYIKAPLPEPTGSTKFVTISSLLSQTSMNWWGNAWSYTLPVGQTATGGSCATAVELLVDPETGEIEVTGIWNCLDTGGTIFKRGTDKENLSGCELVVSQTLFFGDVFDHYHKGCVIGTQYSVTQTPTSMDLPLDNYNIYEIESGDVGPYGAHGIGEPAVTNVGALYGAIFNAIGKFPNPEMGAINPDKVLKSLGKA